MTNCQLKSFNELEYYCECCLCILKFKKIPKTYPKHNCSKPCNDSNNPQQIVKKETRLDCINLGLHEREEGCTTCKGNTRIKIYQCSIYGECTIGKQLPNKSCCQVCEDYKPKP